MTARALPLGLLLLVVSGAWAMRPLAHFWSGNEEYAYGWGVPFLAAYLFYERWRCRPQPKTSRESHSPLLMLPLVILAWALVFLAMRLVIETEPGSRPVLWLAASLLVSALMAWTWLMGGRAWLRHFAFPLAFVLVGVPWIFGFELVVVQELMRWNAEAVAHALMLLAIPAKSAGNTILLPSGQLDVSEACSGIRSLQAALMMALFFGEFYRYGLRGRMGLVAAGIALALAGNFARMFYLADRGAMGGVAAVEAAHDSAGWFILVSTVVGLWLICLRTRGPIIAVRLAKSDFSEEGNKLALTWALGIFAATFFAEVTTQGWYGWRERSAPHYPEWTVAWPESALDFRRDDFSDSVRQQLHAADASQSGWQDAEGHSWSGLWIRYRGDAEGKVVFESHNPGLCLPAAGWQARSGIHAFAVEIKGVRLEVQAQTFESNKGTTQVFWVPYLDGGTRAGADQGRGLYGHTFGALAAGRLPWLADVWAGCRGVNAETLEVAVGGASLEEAESAFRKMMPDLIQVQAPEQSTLVAGGR